MKGIVSQEQPRWLRPVTGQTRPARGIEPCSFEPYHANTCLAPHPPLSPIPDLSSMEELKTLAMQKEANGKIDN